MTAYHHSAGPGPVRRTVIAALCLARLGFSALCLAAQPSQAEDAKAAAQPQAATPANAGAANPQAVAPAPVPSAAPAAAPSNDAAAVPQSGSPCTGSGCISRAGAHRGERSGRQTRT